MMFKRCFFFISCLSLLLNAGAIAQSGSTYRLWYDKPASEWTEALPVGNGRLGAMIYGGVEKEHIQFNEETLWTGRPREHNRQGASAYLDEIRKLLFEGKQQEAEKLAEAHFMGLKSEAGDLDKWIAEVRSLKGMKGNPALPDFDDSSWKTIKVPTYEGWETVGFEGLDGALWFRTTFNVPASWAGKNLVLDLNRIRNQDFTYVNGVLVGNTNDNSGRKYIISKDLIKKGKNTLSVQVLNYYDKGGI